MNTCNSHSRVIVKDVENIELNSFLTIE